jgi:L-threonylcarbamoyladenylate synthase
MKRLEATAVGDAAALLLAGDLVAFPTDTVYGVGACLSRPDAVGRLFVAKNRPESTALPVMVANDDQLSTLLGALSPTIVRLSERFWPGPLTVVTPCSPELAALVGSTSGTLGVRIPNDGTTQALLAITGPLAVTSANQHSKAPSTTADEVILAFEGSGMVSAVLDDGVRNAKPSTVVAVLEGALVELRSGPLSLQSLTQAL